MNRRFPSERPWSQATDAPGASWKCGRIRALPQCSQPSLELSMSLTRLIAPAVICAAIVAPVSADVTLRMTVTDKENGRVTNVTEYRKGLKLRTDSSGGGLSSVSTIENAETGLFIRLWHDGKGAEVFDLKAMAPLAEGKPSEITQSITPTTRSRQIAGSTCTVYEIKTTVRMAERMPEMTEPAAFLMEGSVCVVKNAPGQEDYARVSRAMTEAAASKDPQAAIQRQVAELGVPYATELTLSIGANLPGAELHKVVSHTMEVTSVSIDSIADSLFEMPAGYTVRKR